MNRGYAKLWRKSLDAGWIKNHKLWAFWTWCLMKATYKEYDQVVGCQSIHLMPGDFVFGRKAASVELNMTEQEIRTAVDSMRKRQNITIKSTNKFSIISIVNWEIYQQTEIEINQQGNEPLTSKQPATNHKQEVKEYKNKRSNIFIVPSLEEIKTYCTERKNQIDPQYFLDYQTARDWKLKGGHKIKDWKAVVRTWEKNNFSSGGDNGNKGHIGSNAGFGIPKEYIPEPRLLPSNEEFRKGIEAIEAFKQKTFGKDKAKE